MFGRKKRKRWCNRCRRPAKQCVCRPCPTCSGMAPANYQKAGQNENKEPSPLRIEIMQPLIVVQPIAQPDLPSVPTVEQEPAPKDAPIMSYDDWHEFDGDWEGADDEA